MILENKLTEISLRAENCEKCCNLVEEEMSQTYTSVKEEREKVNNIPSMNIHRFIKRFSGDEISNYNSNYNSNKLNYNSNKNSKNYNSNNSNSKLRYGSNTNFPKNQNISNSEMLNNINNEENKLIAGNDQYKFNNYMNTFNNMNNNSINLNTINEDKVLFSNPKPTIENKMHIEDENIFDENAGGLEYYKYLERTVSFFLILFDFCLIFLFNFQHEEINSNMMKLDKDFEAKSQELINEIDILYAEIEKLAD